MKDKFYELPEEKQLRIINAGLEVFSQNDYKRASTDEIARIAGISKGLLFYYFRNKKEFYFFLHDYASRLVTEAIVDDEYKKITDFFQLCRYAARKKLELLQKMPYISDFTLRAFYSQKEDISGEINESVVEAMAEMFSTYFASVDLTRFKEGTDPQEVLQMLTWMTDGYLHEKRRMKATMSPEDMIVLMEKYEKWASMLKEISYKEEFLK